jgi:hypothetical protein
MEVELSSARMSQDVRRRQLILLHMGELGKDRGETRNVLGANGEVEIVVRSRLTPE